MPESASARDVALRVISAWHKKGGGAEVLLRDAAAGAGLDQRDRALAMELVYGVIRNRINLDFVLSHFIKEPPKGVSAGIRDILRVAAYQQLYLERIPDRAIVFEAVEQAKKAGGRGAGAFVNAVLRALLRGKDKVAYPGLDAEPVRYLSLTYSFPEWLAERWLARFGPEGAAALMDTSNRVPPLTVRANALRTGREGLKELFEQSGVECTPTRYSPSGLVLAGYPPVHELPGYADGLFAVQDEAAQLVSMLAAPGQGMRLLDACAAPGGKTGHLYELSGGRAGIAALDISLDKLRLMKENITRLGMDRVRVLQADAALALPLKTVFDAVLLDAPCSALGVIRRRPEIKYSRNPADITRLSGLQARMMENLAQSVVPGGALVFSTCSTEPEEGEEAVGRFLSANPDFIPDDAGAFLPESARELVTADGFMRTYPHMHAADGFFAARLVRRGR